MRFLFALLFLLLPTETFHRQVDLQPMLQDDKTLAKLTILYQFEPRGNHGYQMFFVHGDGSLLLQAYPERPMAAGDIPTCRNRVSKDQVRGLVRLIVERHFWDLPEKHFIFVYAAQSDDGMDLHTIAIDDGSMEARRWFGVGTYAGKEESMPADFAAVQEQLEALRHFTHTAPEQPCQLAPAVNF